MDEQEPSLSDEAAQCIRREVIAWHLKVKGLDTPIPPVLAATVASSSLPALTRIVLTIDPTLSALEVGEFYRKYRQQVVGERHRDLSPKHLLLAQFVTTRPAGESWEQRMAAWNQAQPAWSYTHVGNFGRDCRQATYRILYLDTEQRG